MEGDGVKSKKVTDTERLDWLEAKGSNWQRSDGNGLRFGFIATSAPGTQTIREAIDKSMKEDRDEKSLDV